MRLIDEAGGMEFKFKNTLSQLPEHLSPWFRITPRPTANIPIVFGHWSALGLHEEANTICLDTGCAWGGSLTAMHFPSRGFLSIPAIAN